MKITICRAEVEARCYFTCQELWASRRRRSNTRSESVSSDFSAVKGLYTPDVGSLIGHECFSPRVKTSRCEKANPFIFQMKVDFFFFSNFETAVVQKRHRHSDINGNGWQVHCLSYYQELFDKQDANSYKKDLLLRRGTGRTLPLKIHCKPAAVHSQLFFEKAKLCLSPLFRSWCSQNLQNLCQKLVVNSFLSPYVSAGVKSFDLKMSHLLISHFRV